MKKEKNINIRVTKQEKQTIQSKSQKSKMSISEYMIKSCLKDNIIVIDGIDKLEVQVRKIGNNLNQLTKLANEGTIVIIDLKELRTEVNQIWQLLKQLVLRQT